MVNRIFWKTTPVRRFTGSATSSSLEFPLPLQKREYKTNKVFELFSHSRKYCVCGYPRMVDAKKKMHSPQKIHMQPEKQPFEKGKSSSKPSSWGSMFFSGVYNVWGNFFIHFSSSLQVPPRLPTRRYLCFFQSLRGIIDLPAARLVHHQNAIQVLQIVEVSVLV